jgi:hypothetical protein
MSLSDAVRLRLALNEVDDYEWEDIVDYPYIGIGT